MNLSDLVPELSRVDDLSLTAWLTKNAAVPLRPRLSGQATQVQAISAWSASMVASLAEVAITPVPLASGRYKASR
nr:hypothetical protein [Deltaproteobacteria bacterium]